jgi:hypothetical protein
MAKAKLSKAAAALNTKKDKESRLVLQGTDFVAGKTVKIVHTKGGKKCVWNGKIDHVSHKKKNALAVDLKAAPDVGYPHPDDDAKPSEDVDVTIQDADPATTTIKVELYTE